MILQLCAASSLLRQAMGLMLIVPRKGKSRGADPQMRTALAERYWNKRQAAEMRLFSDMQVSRV